MRISILLILLLISVMTLGIVHFLALELFLYWQYPYLDVPMHILGGIVVALGMFSLGQLGLFKDKRYLTFLPVMLVVLTAALLWELFEIRIGIPLIEHDFERDMIGDLLCGLIGGVMGFVVAKRLEHF